MESKDKINFRRMKLADKPALLAFLADVFADNPRMSDERFWDWHFLENPYSDKNNLPVWLALSGEKIAGQLAATQVKLQIGDERKDAIWILDLIVHNDFRRRGIAKKLVAAAESFCSVRLGVNTAAQRSTELLLGMNWHLVSRIPRFGKLLFAGNAVREIRNNKFLRRASNSVSRAFSKQPKNPFAPNGKLKIIEKFDSSFDDLWQAAAPENKCAVVREADILNWQFINQPNKKYDIFGYFENEKLLGYAVMFFRRADRNGVIDKAAVSDIFYYPAQGGKIVETLLEGVLYLAREREAGSLVIDAIDDLIIEKLKKNKFRPIKNPLQLLAKSDECGAISDDEKNWFLTRADADISVFEAGNR